MSIGKAPSARGGSEWHVTQSTCAAATLWSNERLAGSAALADVSTPLPLLPVPGREFAWQSMHELGFGSAAALMESWKFAGPTPTAHVVGSCWVGAWWQMLHSSGTRPLVVGASFTHATASCFMAPVRGERGGSFGPTKPVGSDVK